MNLSSGHKRPEVRSGVTRRRTRRNLCGRRRLRVQRSPSSCPRGILQWFVSGQGYLALRWPRHLANGPTDTCGWTPSFVFFILSFLCSFLHHLLALCFASFTSSFYSLFGFFLRHIVLYFTICIFFLVLCFTLSYTFFSAANTTSHTRHPYNFVVFLPRLSNALSSSKKKSKKLE